MRGSDPADFLPEAEFGIVPPVDGFDTPCLRSEQSVAAARVHNGRLCVRDSQTRLLKRCAVVIATGADWQNAPNIDARLAPACQQREGIRGKPPHLRTPSARAAVCSLCACVPIG